MANTADSSEMLVMSTRGRGRARGGTRMHRPQRPIGVSYLANKSSGAIDGVRRPWMGCASARAGRRPAAGQLALDDVGTRAEPHPASRSTVPVTMTRTPRRRTAHRAEIRARAAVMPLFVHSIVMATRGRRRCPAASAHYRSSAGCTATRRAAHGDWPGVAAGVEEGDPALRVACTVKRMRGRQRAATS